MASQSSAVRCFRASAQHLVFLGFHVLPMEFRVGLDRGQEARKFLRASLLVARQRPARASGSSPRLLPMFALQAVEERYCSPDGGCAGNETGTSSSLRMMEALGKRIDVVDHRAEDVEIRKRAAIADGVNQMEHAVQDRRQRSGARRE